MGSLVGLSVGWMSLSAHPSASLLLHSSINPPTPFTLPICRLLPTAPIAFASLLPARSHPFRHPEGRWPPVSPRSSTPLFSLLFVWCVLDDISSCGALCLLTSSVFLVLHAGVFFSRSQCPRSRCPSMLGSLLVFPLPFFSPII